MTVVRSYFLLNSFLADALRAKPYVRTSERENQIITTLQQVQLGKVLQRIRQEHLGDRL
jgi:hypothetical protein